jgi:hypothetical protein
MKLRTIIDILEEIEEELGDGNHDVYIMSQKSDPLECLIDNIAIRKEFIAEETLHEGCSLTDVFFVTGKQVRNGSENAWDEENAD